MLSYCSKCRRNTEKKSKSCKIKNARMMLLSKCEVCEYKKLKYIKDQEATELLSSLGIKTPLGKIPLVGPLLF